MSNQEKSESASTGKPRRGYRPAIVVSVILVAVAIGVALKFNKREQRTVTTAPETTVPEQITRDDPELVVPR